MINQLGGAASPVQHLDKGNRAQASSRTIFLLSCLLILAVFAVYHQAASHPYFNLDDRVYVVDNVHVSAGLRWSTVKWSFISLEAFNWHPLTWLSHALDCTLYGLSPRGPHTTNVILHALNALLLFLILKHATGSLWRSFMVAALFALHPINVEAVVWIAERKTCSVPCSFCWPSQPTHDLRSGQPCRATRSFRALRTGLDVQTSSDNATGHFCCFG